MSLHFAVYQLFWIYVRHHYEVYRKQHVSCSRKCSLGSHFLSDMTKEGSFIVDKIVTQIYTVRNVDLIQNHLLHELCL